MWTLSIRSSSIGPYWAKERNCTAVGKLTRPVSVETSLTSIVVDVGVAGGSSLVQVGRLNRSALHIGGAFASTWSGRRCKTVVQRSR